MKIKVWNSFEIIFVDSVYSKANSAFNYMEIQYIRA
jgi:hypothetical protein